MDDGLSEAVEVYVVRVWGRLAFNKSRLDKAWRKVSRSGSWMYVTVIQGQESRLPRWSKRAAVGDDLRRRGLYVQYKVRYRHVGEGGRWPRWVRDSEARRSMLVRRA